MCPISLPRPATESRTRVGLGGRIVIPATWRRTLGIDVGDDVILVLDTEGLRVLTPAQAVARAQSFVRGRVARGRALSRELIDERKADAKRE